MARLSDGYRTVDIELRTWDSEKNEFTPDWSNDFFNIGNLFYDADEDAYLVKNVYYCIEQAQDWKYGVGDFYCDDLTQEEIDARMIWIDGDVE